MNRIVRKSWLTIPGECDIFASVTVIRTAIYAEYTQMKVTNNNNEDKYDYEA